MNDDESPEVKRLKLALEEANMQIERERQKYEELKRMNDILVEQNRILKRNQRAESLRSSTTNNFQAAERDCLVVCDHIYFKFPWQGPRSVIIQSAWDYIRTFDSIPSDSSSITDENTMLHNIFLDIFICLKEKLNLSADAKLFHEVTMPDDGVPHDYVLSKSNLRATGYPDISAVIEIKLPNVNKTAGEMQACRGLVNTVMASMENSFGINKVSLFFDFESITVYYFEDEYLEAAYRSNNCSCFPVNWKDLETPTLGFQILCHVLSVPIQTPRNVTLEDGTVVRCDGTIFATSNYAIFALKKDDLPMNIPRNQDYVAKVITRKDKHIDGLLRLERKKNQAIYEFEDFREYSVFVPELKIQDGFGMVQGISLVTAANATRKKEELELFELLKAVSLQVFTALFVLHSNAWFHGDIRPYNILLDNENNAKIIDFTTADVFETVRRYHLMQGQYDAFWSDEIIEFEDRPHLYFHRWDYESLVYSILFCSLSPEDAEEAFESYETRREFLANCQSSSRPILRFCNLFMSLVKCLGTAVPDPEFREIVLSTLKKFIHKIE